ncbi:MAG: type II toxin-antitoxin system RelE/ParE family toxin [Puia sp.]|nr:type II toxin-antitoxin system RelE/ParE family toxin [Puia sp.]
MELSIKWNRRAINQFDEAIAYIENDSPASGEKVKEDILLKIGALLTHPQRHKPDRYKTGNDNSFRAFKIHHYRISYRYKGNEIRIIRIRHTKMNPLKY